MIAHCSVEAETSAYVPRALRHQKSIMPRTRAFNLPLYNQPAGAESAGDNAPLSNGKRDNAQPTPLASQKCTPRKDWTRTRPHDNRADEAKQASFICL